jgi:FkbM family methyltransferase
MKKYIYGAGYFGKALAKCLTQQNEEYAFIDQYSKDTHCLQKPIHRIDDIADKNAIIYNSVLQHPINNNAAEAHLSLLHSKGFENVFTFSQSCELFPNALKYFIRDDFLWRSSNQKLWNEELCSQVQTFLADDRSIELFQNIKRFRLEPTLENYISPDIGKQYIDISIDGFPSNNQLKIVDLGAHIGDTFDDFLIAYGNRIQTYDAFEPDPKNVSILKQKINKLGNSKFQYHPLGVSNENKIIGFQFNENSTSHISSDMTNTIQIVKLDDYLPEREVNLMKFDIEGEELSAIDGAEKIIQQHQPNMIVSVYHRSDDLWLLPFKIKKLMPKSKMYLRQHHHWGLELTLYVFH